MHSPWGCWLFRHASVMGGFDAASAAAQQNAFGWAVSNPGAFAREVFGRGSLWR